MQWSDSLAAYITRFSVDQLLVITPRVTTFVSGTAWSTFALRFMALEFHWFVPVSGAGWLLQLVLDVKGVLPLVMATLIVSSVEPLQETRIWCIWTSALSMVRPCSTARPE